MKPLKVNLTLSLSHLFLFLGREVILYVERLPDLLRALSYTSVYKYPCIDKLPIHSSPSLLSLSKIVMHANL